MYLALSGEHVDHIWGLGWLWGTIAFFRQTRLLIRRFRLVEHDDFISRLSMKQNVFQVSSSILVVSPHVVHCYLFNPLPTTMDKSIWNDMDLMCSQLVKRLMPGIWWIPSSTSGEAMMTLPTCRTMSTRWSSRTTWIRFAAISIVTIAAIRYNWNNYTRHNF